MKIEYKDFVGFYRDVYPAGYCQYVISEFERLEKNSVGWDRLTSEGAGGHIKQDYQISIHAGGHFGDPFKWVEPNINGVPEEFEVNYVELFFRGLQKCYDEYSTKFSILRDSGSLRASAMKMQKTSPGGGYHVWHAEQSQGLQNNRALVYMVYLNSLKDENAGGETEFLYQKLRVKPEENMMIFWPAAYTHTHRGNPVLSDEYKYVITGWFYYD
jgi:hypothetical protein